MKQFIIHAAFILLFYEITSGQPLVIKGRIRCMNQSEKSTKGAENIIVVPTFIPSKSRMTASAPPGYFEVQTGMTMQQLQDKQVNVYLISKCSDCKEAVKRIFVSEDQDRQNRDNKVCYVTVKDWKIGKNCNEIELPPRRADSMLQVVMKQPGQSMKEITDATALVGSPVLLNLLTNLVTAVSIFQNGGTFFSSELFAGRIKYGNFLFSSSLTHTANTGFNFSPYRDLSESVFWNPSVIVNSRKPNGISLFTNLKNNGKLTGFFKLTDKISVGAGAIYTMQDEFREVRYIRPGQPNDPVNEDSVLMKLKEYAVYLSPSIELNKKISLGLAVKSVWQEFTIPKKIFIPSSIGTPNTLTDSSIKKQRFDVDVSASFKLSRSFQIGVNIMNLAGSELYADAFTILPPDSNARLQNQRSLGLGLCYKWQRFNFGADLLFTQDDFYDATIGINYVPFNNALISAGLAFKQMSYSASFRIKHFRIAYVNDNGYMVNERRKGKSGILDGKIYGGFSFSF